MGIKAGPKIVTNGLVCDLDPATDRSYSGSGNTWYDLSSNRFNQALTGIGFTTDNKGLMNYTSGNSYTALNSAVNIEGPVTMSYWIKYTSTAGTQTLGITNGANTASSALQIGIRPTAQGIVWKYGGTALLSFSNPVANTWYHYTLTYASNSMVFYINGLINNSTTVAGNTGAAVSLNIGDYLNNGTGNEKIIGYLGNFQLYNRVLTAQEVLQNYNATKGRYGL